MYQEENTKICVSNINSGSTVYVLDTYFCVLFFAALKYLKKKLYELN